MNEYREILRIKPGHADALYNIDVIERRLKAIHDATPRDAVDAAKRDPLSVIRTRRFAAGAMVNLTRQPVDQDW